MATQYAAGDVVTGAQLGDVKVLEAFDATENSPEQYLVLTEGGEVVRTVLSTMETGEAPATEGVVIGGFMPPQGDETPLPPAEHAASEDSSDNGGHE